MLFDDHLWCVMFLLGCRAKESQYATEASSIAEAAQVVITERYAANSSLTADELSANFSDSENAEIQKMTDLGALTITGLTVTATATGTSGRGSITAMTAVWNSKKGTSTVEVTGELANGNWTFSVD
ncbi:MAG: hypothetical protein PHR92_11370 [Lachnospiraceae bacterium]|nr:hypothetical protein [Lachnospiraceae bacterium]